MPISLQAIFIGSTRFFKAGFIFYFHKQCALKAGVFPVF